MFHRTLQLLVEVEVKQQFQYTQVKPDVPVRQESTVSWGEHLYFEMKNLEPEDANTTMIVIRLLNKGWVKNEVIGEFSFSMSGIYFSDEHKMEHAWAALSNYDTEDFSEIKGLIKMSICVTGPKDNAVKLDDD